jgi:uncharacterized protein (TIGR00266 family)
MLKYEIKGEDLPVVICYPQRGQSICCESGGMSWMSPGMEMNTKAGGLGKVFGRAFTGESIFLNEYTARGDGEFIAFASSFPGSIMPFHINPNNGIIVQKRGFLAMEQGLELSTFFQRKIGVGLVGGEGFILQRISGRDGVAFIEIDGSCIEYNLLPGQKIVVSTGHLAAMSESCSIDVQAVKGVKNMVFGGEGIFNTIITGPGKVYLQSMPVCNVAKAVQPYIVTGN